ncbi:MAG: hypothetical protein QXN15_06665 [Candidatus Jordarchaeales archaeon]|nr:hypothetical protein [Candidatus Jordarchaeia archaeon]
MEPKGYSTLFTFVVLAFALIYALYTIPMQIALGAIPYLVDTRILVSFFAYGGITGAAAFLTLTAYRASRPLVGAGRRVIEYFTIALAFYMMSTAAMTLGLGLFIATGISFSLTWYGLIYPYCIPMAMMFAGISPYFMLKFSYWMAEQKDPGRVREASVLAPLSILLPVMVLPLNWFGGYPPVFSLLDMNLKIYLLGLGIPYPILNIGVKIYPDIRLFSNGLLLLVNLVAVTQIIAFLYRKAMEETDHVKAARLKTVLYGFLSIVGFFACYTLDAIIGGGFTILMFIGFALLLTAIILLYLGVVAPEWYASWLQKRRTKT